MNNNAKAIGTRIKQLRLEHNLSQEALGKKINSPKSTISNYETGFRVPKRSILNELSEIFNVSVDYILNGKSSLPDNTIPIDSIAKVPIIGTIACGTPILAEQNISGYEYLPTSLIPEDGEAFFLKCKGNSMEPTIKNGSLVLIHQQPYVDDNEIAAVEINEEATLKRIKHLDGQILLMPDNKDYSPIILKKHDDNRILGKAIRVINDL